ncbi:MAG: hypothetical protein RLZZ135_554 [Cyanobacteriota bacterium]|jgi:hypothetical protein
MKNNISKILTALLTIGISIATAETAHANPFGFLNDINNAVSGINNTVNSIKRTQQNTGDTLGNLTNLLGISQPANNNADSGGSTSQVLDLYFKWYNNISASDKEIINWLTTQYAEDTLVNFSGFSKSPLYQGKDSQGKSQASALFFKFNELTKAVEPQKDKFLAFAFCVNGGGKNCK